MFKNIETKDIIKFVHQKNLSKHVLCKTKKQVLIIIYHKFTFKLNAPYLTQGTSTKYLVIFIKLYFCKISHFNVKIRIILILTLCVLKRYT